MVPDPYKVLNLPHTATSNDIKRSYRNLARQYHPDRCAHPGDGKEFADLAAAYAILSDPKRKAEYDHIYKYGGFDEEPEAIKTPQPQSQQAPSKRTRQNGMGVGYTCHDPFLTFFLTKGRIRSTKNLVGIQIPSRFSLGSNGFRFAVSSGQCFRTDPATGKRTYTSRTTQFVQGQRITRTETQILHKDGRKEVLVVDKGANGDHTKRYYVTQASHEEAARQPDGSWYMDVWHELKDKLTMCYSPCSAVMYQQ